MVCAEVSDDQSLKNIGRIIFAFKREKGSTTAQLCFHFFWDMGFVFSSSSVQCCVRRRRRRDWWMWTETAPTNVHFSSSSSTWQQSNWCELWAEKGRIDHRQHLRVGSKRPQERSSSDHRWHLSCHRIYAALQIISEVSGTMRKRLVEGDGHCPRDMVLN